MKLWIDDVRPAPNGYFHCKSVNKAKRIIEIYSSWVDWDNNIVDCIELIDIDHDAGSYASDGGDYIKLLDWLEETGRNYPIHIHSQNPVGVENMRRIIQKNGWKEIKEN
jgi:hypothetical protein